jgi:hypothetical protein
MIMDRKMPLRPWEENTEADELAGTGGHTLNAKV